eukprot:scaffold79417_cov70-Phaeocystis_antarctica.AAC.1
MVMPSLAVGRKKLNNPQRRAQIRPHCGWHPKQNKTRQALTFLCPNVTQVCYDARIRSCLFVLLIRHRKVRDSSHARRVREVLRPRDGASAVRQ